MSDDGGPSQGGMTRRDALKRGAVIAGTAVWVAPVVQALTVSQASAEQPSGGPDSDEGKGKQKQKD